MFALFCIAEEHLFSGLKERSMFSTVVMWTMRESKYMSAEKEFIPIGHYCHLAYVNTACNVAMYVQRTQIASSKKNLN